MSKTSKNEKCLNNNFQGSQSWQMEVKFELRSSGFIFAILEKSISTEARAAAKGMRLFEDNLGGVFDLPSEMTDLVESKWRDTETLQLKKCEVLPDLAPLKFDKSGSFGGGSDRRSFGRNSFGGGNRNGGSRGGGRGRGGNRGGGGGAWKRKKY